jgi:hypothetical protein
MLKEEMSNPQEIGQKVKDQTMDTVRKTQDAVAEAVTAWSEHANAGPAFNDFTKQFPTVAEFIDANFDFAQRILSNQRDFAHRIIAATTPKSDAAKTKAKAATPKAVEAATAAKKNAPAKTSAAAKKASPVRQPGTAATN